MPDELTMTISGTSRMVLDALADALAREPEAPKLDGDITDRHYLAEIARHHDDWSREVDAFRLVLGLQLVNRALDAVAATRASPEPTRLPK